ncbi:MAG: cbb3-type cytochrome oxidase assembly protein CcoS [Phycisphaerales bacterium]
MSVIYIVLPLALVFVGLALAGFIMAVRRGQFDDLDTPASRMLGDDD